MNSVYTFASARVAKTKVRLPALHLNWRSCCLIFVVLLSAFAVVYLKDFNRRQFIQYQNLQAQGGQMNVEWNKLLLEESAWSRGARVQDIASKQLHMVIPSINDVVMVQA